MVIKKKNIVRLSIVSSGVIISLIICCYIMVSVNANGNIYDKAEDIPYNKVGLLLGTSPITPQGEHNYYFDNRIQATAELYQANSHK